MPAILKINPQKKVVHSTFFGVVTDAELLDHSQAIAGHPDFLPSFDEIIDLTMVTDLRITTTAMHELAGRESIFASAARHVIVAPKDFSFQKAEEFKRLAETNRPTLSVVRSASEAYEILGLK